jgi:UDP-N-acetylglucosamine acyltransferase
MAYSHIPHDSHVGDNCIIANAVQMGGHTHVEDWVIIGGGTVVHQFSLIGEHAMVGGGLRITQDVPPYILAGNEPVKYAGLNVIGLRRRGFKSEDIEIIKEAYGYLYDKSMNISQAVKKIESKFGNNNYVEKILNFISRSKRGIIGK